MHNFGNSNLSWHPVMWVCYELTKTANLLTGDYQIILTSLYLAEMANYYLITLHYSDEFNEDSQPKIGPRRERLKKAENDFSELLSSLSINTNHLHIDDMIGDLA